MERLKLAVVGCGAVAKFSHLPAIARVQDIELVALVDKSLPRARQLAEECSIELAVLDDYRLILGKAEAAIVALPNALHAPIAIDLLNHGVHVLVEKPMALNGHDCEAMIAAATNNDRVLAVGMVRRFFESSKFVKQVLERRLLGNIKHFGFREGRIFDWQLASDAMFRKDMAGGGALVDVGVHVLDLLLWWFGDCELVSYCDDSEGGLEADCEIRLRFQNGLTGIVELSRTRNLRNNCVIEGDRGTLTVEAGSNSVHLVLPGEHGAFSGRVTPPEFTEDPVQLAFRNQLENFAGAIRKGSAPFVPGYEGKRAVHVIESCYSRRQPLVTWEHGEETKSQLPANQWANLSGKRVLVTGGTGFIGGRLIEKLVLDCNAQVRVLVRNYSRAAGIARFPVEMIQGDVADAADVARAMEGYEIVVHCAYGNTGTEEQQKRINVEGTRNVLETAAQCKVERVVHLSTLMVYGIPKDGDLDETAPKQRMGLAYADSKLDAENLAFEYCQRRGVPVCVIQPTTVYGPHSAYQTVAVLESLKSSKVILIDGGEGACNSVYVDDVVTSLLLAATHKAAVGEAFLISGEHSITWREFYEEYERMLGNSSTVSMSAEEARKYYIEQQRGRGLLSEAIAILRADYRIRERILRTPEMRFFRNVARFLLPRTAWEAAKRRVSGPVTVASHMQSTPAPDSKPMPAVSPPMIRFYAAKGTVRIDKAKKLLGYEPAFDLRAGMKRTEQWARWANLLG